MLSFSELKKNVSRGRFATKFLHYLPKSKSFQQKKVLHLHLAEYGEYENMNRGRLPQNSITMYVSTSQNPHPSSRKFFIWYIFGRMNLVVYDAAAS